MRVQASEASEVRLCFGTSGVLTATSCPQLECQSYGNGAHLASLLSLKEANVTAEHIRIYQRNKPVWIGLHDPQKVTSDLAHKCPPWESPFLRTDPQAY